MASKRYIEYRGINPNELLYLRVKFLCKHKPFEAEKQELLGLSHGSALRLKKKITDLKITFDQVLSLTPTELKDKFFSGKPVPQTAVQPQQFLEPDYAEISRRLMLSKDHSGGSTNRKLEAKLNILYEDIYCSEENKRICAEKGLKLYSQNYFYKLWRRFTSSKIPPSFRRQEPPGASAEFDFTGVKMRCADGTLAEFAVMVLNYSRLIYVEAIPSQNTQDSANAIVNAFRFYGGVPYVLKCDNFRACVKRPSRYGGEFTDTFRMLSNYFGFQLSSMPPRKGNLKGAVEVAVRIVTDTLLTRMKMRERDGEPFRNLYEMNSWLRRNLHRINDKRVRGFNRSRQEMFDQDERDLLLKPRSWDFRVSNIMTKTVGPTSRFTFNKHDYALQPSLIGHRVQVEMKPSQVVFYEGGCPICTYQRQDGIPGLSTKPGYTPPTHLYIEVLKATPLSMYFEWAQAIGPETLRRVKAQLKEPLSIDKYRRAAKFLQLPHENPDWYPVFERFLRQCPHYMGVGKLEELWKEYPQKPNSTRKDGIYSFSRLFSMIEARLFGEKVDINWHSGKEKPQKAIKGRVFLNHDPDQYGKVYCNYKPSDHLPDKPNDLVPDKAGDLIADKAGDLCVDQAADLNSTTIHENNTKEQTHEH